MIQYSLCKVRQKLKKKNLKDGLKLVSQENSENKGLDFLTHWKLEIGYQHQKLGKVLVKSTDFPLAGVIKEKNLIKTGEKLKNFLGKLMKNCQKTSDQTGEVMRLVMLEFTNGYIDIMVNQRNVKGVERKMQKGMNGRILVRNIKETGKTLKDYVPHVIEKTVIKMENIKTTPINVGVLGA